MKHFIASAHLELSYHPFSLIDPHKRVKNDNMEPLNNVQIYFLIFLSCDGREQKWWLCPFAPHSFCVFHLLLFPSLHNLQFNLEFPFIAYSVLYGAGNCIWRRIYQSNFHNIKNQSSAQALGMKPGVLWPSSAWFGPILCSIGQAHYASALAQILNLSISTGITPPLPQKKFLGSVQAVASKVTSCHRVLNCHCGGPSATRKPGTVHMERATHMHATSHRGWGSD